MQMSSDKLVDCFGKDQEIVGRCHWEWFQTLRFQKPKSGSVPLSACGSGCKEKYKMYRQFEEQKVTGECPVGAEHCTQGDTSLKDGVKME